MARPVWDERLITRTRALELAGTHPLYVEFDEIVAEMRIRCEQCGQSCGLFPFGPGEKLGSLASRRLTSVQDMLAGVLRHLVIAHDLVLSGAGGPGGGDRDSAGDADAGVADAAGRRGDAERVRAGHETQGGPAAAGP